MDSLENVVLWCMQIMDPYSRPNVCITFQVSAVLGDMVLRGDSNVCGLSFVLNHRSMVELRIT
jgi:hypothetical protein